MGSFCFSWLNSGARGLLRHLLNNTARKWRPSVPTAYELFTRAVVCSASFRNGIDRFKWQRLFWEMASTISNGNDCLRKGNLLHQHRLSVRARTIVDQKLPDDWEGKVANFHQFVLRGKEELGIQGDRVFNMDEVPMSFDAPFSRTVDATRAETIPVYCCPCMLRIREEAQANGNLQAQNNAERKSTGRCGGPLPQERMDGQRWNGCLGWESLACQTSVLL